MWRYREIVSKKNYEINNFADIYLDADKPSLHLTLCDKSVFFQET